MTERRTNEGTAGQTGDGRALKRRGLIAGAAALAAGLLATRTSQPVAAALIPVQYSTDPNNYSPAFTSNAVFVGTRADFSSAANGNAAFIGYSNLPGVDAIQGQTVGGGRHGVLGTTTTSGAAGLAGQGNAAGSYGVYGSSTSGIGVSGSSSSSYGVYGTSAAIAVYGLSSGSYGVVGGTTASGGYGGYFATAANNSFGLRAEVQGAATGSYGLYATAPAGSKAAYFTGDVYINGSLTVADMTQKHGLLRGPDGASHLLYTMEAPESWAEDFGTGTLTNGKATVTIDPLFASLVHTDDYHVFLTPHADTNGLHVTQRGPAGFEVAEHKGGTANLTFSYRVVARPKGGKVERLGTYAVPPEPPPAPPLPKVPEPPVVPTVAPPKKP